MLTACWALTECTDVRLASLIFEISWIPESEPESQSPCCLSPSGSVSLRLSRGGQSEGRQYFCNKPPSLLSSLISSLISPLLSPLSPLPSSLSPLSSLPSPLSSPLSPSQLSQFLPSRSVFPSLPSLLFSAVTPVFIPLFLSTCAHLHVNSARSLSPSVFSWTPVWFASALTI